MQACVCVCVVAKVWFELAVNMCVCVHFLCVCVRGVSCLHSISACSSPQALQASTYLGGLAHTQDSVYVCVYVCSGLATTQNPKIQIALEAGPQPSPNPHPLLQCTTFKYLTKALHWLLLHTCLVFFVCVFLSRRELKMC